MLFNLDEDPGEIDDLGINPSHEDIRSELLERLYDGWNPEFARMETERVGRDREILVKWA